LNNYCSLCPNACKVDRSTSTGLCGVSDKLKIAKFYIHPYEEPIISGEKGSGTIFFCGCPLRCVFCQNYEVSRNLTGKEISIKELSEIFKILEEQGANNINLVNPSHYSDKIIQALDIYKPSIPIVYNTHGY
jgi:putative pyruvate formate lyase activating enzyme